MIFSNDNIFFLKNISNLPDEIIDIIKEYIPQIVNIFLTRQNYIENHHLIKSYINRLKIEDYIRTMIRQDNEFVFGTMLSENWDKWLSMKKCYYRGCIYSNYLIFLNAYCIDYESYKCKRILTEYFLEQGMSKNQHKKNAVKYIRWKA
jgi:hypothetical protein